MVSLKKWLYGLMFGILVMGWFLIQSQDVVFWVPSFKWDIQGKLEKDSVQERYFELVAQENDMEVDEIKHIYDNYVSNDKIEFFKGYTREHTNDMLGRERSYLETATFTLGENELVMVKADNVPTPIFGCGETFKSCFTTDFTKISSKKELFCCGCVDGGTRIYELETKNN